MERKNLFFLILFSLSFLLNAQVKNFKFFPSELNVQPFTANILEPRLGFVFQTSGNSLRLDAGRSLDMLHLSDEKFIFSFGFDMFTYTLLRSETDFHFPVDAIDYLFGLNFSLKKIIDKNSNFGLRFRLSHISAHFADGHFDPRLEIWRNGRKPIVYSREFIEFLPFFEYRSLRVYSGITYVFHIDPNELGTEMYHLGFDYYSNQLFQSVYPFIGFNLELEKLYNNFRGNNSLIIGIKLGNKNSRGLSIFYSYYSGNNFHGEYFDLAETYSAIGFNFDI